MHVQEITGIQTRPSAGVVFSRSL